MARKAGVLLLSLSLVATINLLIFSKIAITSDTPLNPNIIDTFDWNNIGIVECTEVPKFATTWGTNTNTVCLINGLFLDENGVYTRLPANLTQIVPIGQSVQIQIQNAPEEWISWAQATALSNTRLQTDSSDFIYSSTTTLVMNEEALIFQNCLPNLYHIFKGCVIPFYANLKLFNRINSKLRLIMIGDWPNPYPNEAARNLYFKTIQQIFNKDKSIIYSKSPSIPWEGRKIFIPTAIVGIASTPYSFLPSTQFMMELRMWIYSQLNFVPHPPTDPYVLFVSRQKGRQIVNEREAHAVTSQFANYSVVEFTNMTLLQQIEIMQNVTVFVGSFGAALTNVLWMHPNTTLLDIVPEKGMREQMYQVLAEAINVNHIFFKLHGLYGNFDSYCTGWTLDEIRSCENGSLVESREQDSACCYYYIQNMNTEFTPLGIDNYKEILTQLTKKNSHIDAYN